MKNIKKLTTLFIFSILTFGLVGCGATEATEDTDKTAASESENLSLKIGVMPAVDSLPIFLAAEKGYFEELGVDVEVQVYTNAMNRQSALQTGELDGAMTDVIALVNNVQNGFNIKITTSTDGVFPFLINKDYQEKEKIKVGMMEVSVTNYLADKALAETHQIEKVYINEIPARLQMIGQGQLDMAVVPEPMASQGALNGLTKQLIDFEDEYSPEVMVFNSTAISKKEEAIQLFHDAYNMAVEDLLVDDSEGRELLIDTLDLKPEIKDTMILPAYHLARVPSEDYLQGIIEWNESVLGEKVDLKYEELVEERFVE